jgi:hypothetical protein
MGSVRHDILVLFLALAMAPAGSCGGVPDDLSAVVLTLEVSDPDASCGLVYVTLTGGEEGAGDESWGFLTSGRFPHTEEIRTGLEGALMAGATGYACAGEDCRDARRDELVVSRGAAALVLSHGHRTAVTLVLEPVVHAVCGNAVVEEGEECEPGEITPQDPCLADCTYPLHAAVDRAGGSGDGLVLLPDGPGFAAAWTFGAGDDEGPDGLSLLGFDENGRALSSVARNFLPGSCLDGRDPVFPLFDPTGWGGGDPAETILLWRERRGEDMEGLCLTRIDAAAGTDVTLALGESVPWSRKSPVARVDAGHVAVAVLEGGTFFVLVADMGGGLESGRAAVREAAADVSCGPIHLASLGGRLLAAAWQETAAAGTVSTWLRRWHAADGVLTEADPEPLLVKQESQAEARGIELLAPAQDQDCFILAVAAASAVETAWIGEHEDVQDLEWVPAVGAASPDDFLAAAAAADSRSLFVLMASPAGTGERCAYRLVEVFGPGLGGGWRTASSWGPETDLGCRAGLVPLGAGRAAAGFLTIRETASGLFEGELSVDISR